MLKQISKYRFELLGVATLMIIICHSSNFVNFGNSKMDFMIRKIVTYGNLGVPIFAFLSGWGIYYSLDKKTDLRDFYFRRFKRTILPYLCIVGGDYLVIYCIIDFNPIHFLYELSTLSFWIEHSGMWYIAFILPMYIVSPWIYSKIEKTEEEKGLFFTIILLLFIGFCVYLVEDDLFHHLSNVYEATAIFIVGMYQGKKNKQNKENSIVWIIFPVLLYIFNAVSRRLLGFVLEPLRVLGSGLLGVSMCYGLGYVFNWLKQFKFNFLRKLGRASLESYCFNFVLIGILYKLQSRNAIFGKAVYEPVIYLFFVGVLGIILSLIYNYICTNKK